MATGRPTKYDPAFCDQVLPFMEQGYSTTALAGHTVIYALCDHSGKPFYVGKSKNLSKRLEAYAAQRSHGNQTLAVFLKDWVKHKKFKILDVDPESVNDAEYGWIAALPDLCNIMQKPFHAKTKKPWVAAGVKCPSAQVRMHVKKNLNGNVDWIKGHANNLSDLERLRMETRIARSCLNTCLGKHMQKWLDGVAA